MARVPITSDQTSVRYVDQENRSKRDPGLGIRGNRLSGMRQIMRVRNRTVLATPPGLLSSHGLVEQGDVPGSVISATVTPEFTKTLRN